MLILIENLDNLVAIDTSHACLQKKNYLAIEYVK
jgi:hypothetical protein